MIRDTYVSNDVLDSHITNRYKGNDKGHICKQ